MSTLGVQVTITTLDVSTLPRTATFVCPDGAEIDMFDLMERVAPAIQALLQNNCVKISKTVNGPDSFGFAMAKPYWSSEWTEHGRWSDPSKLVWFVYGWGPDQDKYIANAVRKLRALLREGAASTLLLRLSGESYRFIDVVDSVNDDGSFSWGDFPWGGAVELEMDDLIAAGAVSCYTEVEDDIVARLPLSLFCKEVMEAEGLPTD